MNVLKAMISESGCSPNKKLDPKANFSNITPVQVNPDAVGGHELKRTNENLQQIELESDERSLVINRYDKESLEFINNLDKIASSACLYDKENLDIDTGIRPSNKGVCTYVAKGPLKRRWQEVYNQTSDIARSPPASTKVKVSRNDRGRSSTNSEGRLSLLAKLSADNPICKFISKLGRRGSTDGKRPDGAITKFGNNSISGTGVTEPSVKILDRNAAQNLIQYLQDRVPSDGSFLHLSADGAYIEFHQALNNQDPLFRHPHTDFSDYWNIYSQRVFGQTTITAVERIIIDSMPVTINSEYFGEGGNPNIRVISGQLSSRIGFAAPAALDIATSACGFLERADNTSFYAKGWAMMFLLCHIEQAEVAVRWSQNGVEWRDRAILSANIAEEFRRDVQDRCFFFVANSVNARMRMCLRHWARPGFPYLDRYGLEISTFRLGCVDWFPINMAFYGGPVAQDQVGNVTSLEMRHTILTIAEARGEIDYCVYGFVKAMTILCQRHGYEAGDPFFNCTLEQTSTMQWYRPMGSNPIWAWCGVEPPLPDPILCRGEFTALASAGPVRQLMLAYSGGTIISSGVSLALNANNITGRTLTALSGLEPDVAVPTNAQSALFNSTTGYYVPAIFLMALGEVANLSPIVISHRGLAEPYWCANFVDMVGGVQALWRDTFQWRIPYLLNPWANSWWMESWPAVYGVFSAEVRINISADVIMTGPQIGWYADAGDDAYRQISQSSYATNAWWRFIAYGLCVINAYAQIRRAGEIWPIGQRLWGIGFNPHAVGHAVVLGDDLVMNRDFSPEMHTYTPGCLPTFNWADMVTRAPVVTEAFYNSSLWATITQPDTSVYTTAGIIKARRPVVQMPAQGTMDMSQYMQGLQLGIPGRSVNSGAMDITDFTRPTLRPVVVEDDAPPAPPGGGGMPRHQERGGGGAKSHKPQGKGKGNKQRVVDGKLTRSSTIPAPDPVPSTSSGITAAPTAGGAPTSTAPVDVILPPSSEVWDATQSGPAITAGSETTIISDITGSQSTVGTIGTENLQGPTVSG